MNSESYRATLREFILENYLFSDNPRDLNDSDSFLTTGILDSMGILELVAFLEEDLGVKVDTSEMVPDNLDSIDNLLAFINKKAAALV